MNPAKFGRVDLIRREVGKALEGVYTCIPAIVRSYNADTQRVDVTLSISQNYDNLPSGFINAPNIPEVPVVFPFGDNFRMGWTLKAGDNVLLFFSMRPLDEYEDSAGSTPVVPESLRRHSMDDAIAFAGMMPSTTRDGTYKEHPHLADEETYIVFNKDGTDGLYIETNKKVHINATDDVKVQTPATVDVTCNLAKVTAPNSTFSGNVSIGGNLTVAGTSGLTGAVTASGTMSAGSSITAQGEVIGNGVNLSTHVHAHGNPNTSAPL